MNPEVITEILSELRVLPFFPNDEFAMLPIVRLAGSMCETQEQVRWLVDRMTSGIYAEWPGMKEMRACYCSRFRPRDGINAYSDVYHDGLPPEKGERRGAILPAEMKALPEGNIASADSKAENAVKVLALCQSMKQLHFNGQRKGATPEEIATAPQWLRRLSGYE